MPNAEAKQVDTEPDADSAAEEAGSVKPGPKVVEKVPEEKEGRNVDALMNVKMNVRVVLGHNRIPVSELLQLTRGSVIELDRKVGDPVDIMINDRIVARGDLIKIDGDMIGVALREIIKDFIPTD